jgi:hypothetical protein
MKNTTHFLGKDTGGGGYLENMPLDDMGGGGGL